LALVRDDFGLAAARFFQDVEVPLREGHNFAIVDLFEVAHARRVLVDFGRALGRVTGEPTGEVEQFLQEAVRGLARGGKVAPLLLSLFVEMVKAELWLPTSLRALGGSEGVGIAYLEKSLGARPANPAHRALRPALRAILESLLPTSGSELKAGLKTREELLS